MATTRLMPLHTGKGRTVGTAIEAIIDYVANPEKTDSGRLITSWQCDSRVADREFLLSKQQYIKNTGRVRGVDDVIAYHLRQSFRPGEITPEEANRLGCELARRFTKGNHAYIVCTHIDKAHIHNHVIWNSTALDEHSKFRNFWGSTKALRRLNDTICVENGYSIVENPKGKGKSYDKWLGNQKQPSHRERICYAIDEALAQKPQSFEKLLELLQRSGYQVKGGNKVLSLLGEGQKRFIRMDTLGAGYTPDDLRAIIAGTKVHTPKKKRVILCLFHTILIITECFKGFRCFYEFSGIHQGLSILIQRFHSLFRTIPILTQRFKGFRRFTIFPGIHQRQGYPVIIGRSDYQRPNTRLDTRTESMPLT